MHVLQLGKKFKLDACKTLVLIFHPESKITVENIGAFHFAPLNLQFDQSAAQRMFGCNRTALSA